MELERRERHGRIKDSDVAVENTVAGDSEPAAGDSRCSGQVVWILHRTTDLGSGRILDPSLHTGKPGECDPAFHLPWGVHWDSSSVQDSKHSAWKDQ